MPWSNASMVLNSRDLTAGQYNNAQFNSLGQNIVQGQIHSVSVSEVNFPYDIPNVQTGFNNFVLYDNGVYTLDIVVPPGFYTGTELANAISEIILTQGAAQVPPVPPDSLPECNYNASHNQFTFAANNQDWEIISPYTNPSPGILPSTRLGKDLLSIMGYPLQGGPLQIGPGVGGVQVAVSGSAPLVFTQYIDVCSPQLCKYQDLNTGSTTNLARRTDLLTRLYIANNIAVQEPEGLRPFIINRQYTNARIMKWNTGDAVGTIDITLYDDTGQPLTTTWAPRPYQITFNVYEMDAEADDAEYEEVTTMGFGGVSGKKLVKIGGGKSYVNRNAGAWQNLSRQ